jgi:hypothetical protein
MARPPNHFTIFTLHVHMCSVVGSRCVADCWLMVDGLHPACWLLPAAACCCWPAAAARRPSSSRPAAASSSRPGRPPAPRAPRPAKHCTGVCCSSTAFVLTCVLLVLALR